MMVRTATREWKLEGDLAKNYERYFVPTIFRPWAATLLDTVQLRPGDRLLDVATGTGIVARLASERVAPTGSVAGVDLNAGMLAVAASATPEDVSIDWRQANADSLPFPDGAFDVVLCQQGLQFFPNNAGALNEMYRVLGPGGRVAISVWRDVKHIPGYDALTEALTRHVSPEAGSFFRMTGALDDAAELRRLLEDAGFEKVNVRPSSGTLRFSSVEAFVWEAVQCTPLAWMASVTQANDLTRANVIGEMEAKLSQYLNADGLTFPIEAHIATAQRRMRE
jgi:ubiquinone/menaquinone biosynthesis C-methylase UbiE